MQIYTFKDHYLGTASKKYMKSAVSELKKIDEKIKIIDRFPEGVFSFSTSLDNKTFLSSLETYPPIFLRHIHPIHGVLFIPENRWAPDTLGEFMAPLGKRIKPGKKTSVQARRLPGEYDHTLFSYKNALDPILRDTFYAQNVVQRPEQIVSIFITPSTEIDIKNSMEYEQAPQSPPPWKQVALIGISTPRENLCEWSGGIVRFSKEMGVVSRAEFKLLEAMEIFEIPLPQHGIALDLGSSPGGWTKVLVQKGLYVTSVDQAPLEPNVAKLPGVRYVQAKAEHFRSEPENFDLLASDINRDPVKSARSLIAVAPFVKKNAPFIMTIKLADKNFPKLIEKTLGTLKESYIIKGVKQLYNNRDEVTVWGTKK